MWSPQTGFNSGQLSKGAISRIGTPEHALGSLLIENGVVTEDSDLRKRPGTFSGGAVSPTAQSDAILIPFEVRGDRPYVFEVTEGLIRIWDVKARAVIAQEFQVPYEDEDLPKLHFSRESITLGVTTVRHAPRLFTKSRLGPWKMEVLESSLIIFPSNQKTILLRTGQEPGFAQQFDVYSGLEGSATPYFEPTDLGCYFRHESGWIFVEEVISSFQVKSKYLGITPPFAISTTDWVGPFRGQGVSDLGANPPFDPVTTSRPEFICKVEDEFIPGDLIQITFLLNDDSIEINGSGLITGGGTEFQFLTDADAGGLLDLSGGEKDLVSGTSNGAPWGADAVSDYGQIQGQFVVQIYDIRDGGKKCAGYVVQGSATGSPASPAFFVRGPELFAPDLRDVPNSIIQPEDPTGSGVELRSSAGIFGPEVIVGDVLGFLGGSARIDEIVSPNLALISILDPLDGRWSTDTWGTGTNNSTGFPATCAFHQDRFVVGGIPADPGTVWFSKVSSFTDFRLGNDEIDGLTLPMTSSDGDQIRWIRSMSDLRESGQGILAVGTDSAEFRLAGAISPLDIPGAVAVSYFGSAPVQPAAAGSSLLFVHGSGKSVRDLRLFQNVEFPTEDVTQYAVDQFRDSAPRAMAYSNAPFGFLVVVRHDGSVTSCSYRRDLGINAWIPWPGITARSVCAVKRDDGPDELWMIVERQGSLYVEIMTSDAVLDAAVQVVPSTGVISGLDHLEGETVTVRSGGVKVGEYLVAGGAISVPPSSSSAVAGLPSPLRLVPLVNEVEDRDGSSYGRQKQIDSLRVQVTDRSGVPSYRCDDSDRTMTLMDGEDFWYQVDGLSEHSVVSSIEIYGGADEPFEIAGYTVNFDVKDV